MNRSRAARRSGYMLLVSTLAAAALSMAAIAIMRSGQHQIALLDAQRNRTQAKSVADGLYQRAIAILRSDDKASGTFVDPASGMPDARLELQRRSKDETRIQVFLYPRSTVPAIDVSVDPTSLETSGGGGGGGGKGKGKGKDKGKKK